MFSLLAPLTLIHVVVLLWLTTTFTYAQLKSYPQCDDPWFCQGTALHAFQMSHIFPDDKEFVDLVLNVDNVEELRRVWAEISSDQYSDHKLLQNFLDLYTLPTGSDIAEAKPTDFDQNPKFLSKVDQSLQVYASEVHSRWNKLLRKQNSALFCAGCSSIIPVPQPFIVAGGRFREFYYWDSYWIMKGLLVSDMPQTARGMIDNFLWVVDKYGFVPNGGRKYYLNRSQPPMLTLMVQDYYTKLIQTKKPNEAAAFLASSFPFLEKEYKFFTTGDHAVTYQDISGQLHMLSRYFVGVQAPRPEGYKVDYDLVRKAYKEQPDQDVMYQHIAAAAESGWDFSSRWFGDGKTMETIRTMDIIPVDLNSILYKVEKTLAFMAQVLKNGEQSTYFFHQATLRKKAIYAAFWNKKHNTWFDFHLPTRSQIINPTTDSFKFNLYTSSLLPIWSGASHLSVQNNFDMLSNDILPRFIQPGGIAVSNIDSKEQWDQNIWAPLQWFISDAIHTTWSTLQNDKTIQPTPQNNPMLFDIINKWITTTYCGWKKTTMFYEKYHPQNIGKPGGSGEYAVQDGFGWTNGLILEYLNKYPNFIKSPLQC